MSPSPPVLEARLVDITTLSVDAIVNAANTDLAPGGGVCGAIHRSAGPELEEACRKIGRCPTGEARMTPGFNLPSRYVIHAVGPVWQGGGTGEPLQLSNAYRSSMDLAKQNALTSIAFPAFSTGIYGYPLGPATLIAVSAVREALEDPGSIRRVAFACFSQEALAEYAFLGIPS